MDPRKQNHVEEAIEKEMSVRHLYPGAYFVWFLAGATPTDMVQKLRSKVLADMSRLGSLGMRNNTKIVAICTDNAAADVAAQYIPKLAQWLMVRLEGLDSPNVAAYHLNVPIQVAARSADMVLCYGNPTDALYEMLDEVDPEDPPQLEVRTFEDPAVHRQKVNIDPNSPDPYGVYWQRVNRLRRWYKAPWNGKPPLRALIRPYPVYSPEDFDGENFYSM